MSYRYRPIRYFTELEAKREADRLNGEARRANMAGSHYEEDREQGGWVVNHYVMRNLSGSLAKSGWLPYDYEEGYREGYHHYRAG